MHAITEAYWTSLSTVDRERIWRDVDELDRCIEAKLDRWRSLIDGLEDVEPGLPERVLQHLRIAYVAEEGCRATNALASIVRDRGDGTRDATEMVGFLVEQAAESVRVLRAHLDAASSELFPPRELEVIHAHHSTDDERLEAAYRLAQQVGRPLHKKERRRLEEQRKRVKNGKFEAARDRHPADARRDFAKDVRDQEWPASLDTAHKRAAASAMCTAVLGLAEPRDRVWLPSRSQPTSKRVFDCRERPFVPWDNTFWPILRRWLNNAYRDEYLDTLHIDAGRGKDRLVELAEETVPPTPGPAETFDRDSCDTFIDSLDINAGARAISQLVVADDTPEEACQKLGRGVNQPARWRRQMAAALERAGVV
jgi:hypothetical protein